MAEIASCEHEGPYVGRACVHQIAVGDDVGYREAFTGRGVELELLCATCAATADHSSVVATCAACDEVARACGCEGTVGKPEIRVAASTLVLAHEEVELGCPDFVDLRPVTGSERNRWLGVTASGELYEVDLDLRTARFLLRAEHVVAPAIPSVDCALHVSADGRFAAIVQRRGTLGVVYDMATARPTLTITRDGYHSGHCVFPLAFAEEGARTLVIYAPLWNRIDVADAATGELLSVRELRANYDYFHSALCISPQGTRIADSGWIWGATGLVTMWSLTAWLARPDEPEDGASRRSVRDCDRWNRFMTWLDERYLAVGGYGVDPDSEVDAILIYDATTGERARWFGSSGGYLAFDRWLYLYGGGRLGVWDVETGTRLYETETSAARYHPSAKVFVSLPAKGRISIGRLRGQYADAPWNRDAVAALVRAAEPTSLAVLGDALEAAGCDDPVLLDHCREPEHGPRCWVFDRLDR